MQFSKEVSFTRPLHLLFQAGGNRSCYLHTWISDWTVSAGIALWVNARFFWGGGGQGCVEAGEPPHWLCSTDFYFSEFSFQNWADLVKEYTIKRDLQHLNKWFSSHIVLLQLTSASSFCVIMLSWGEFVAIYGTAPIHRYIARQSISPMSMQLLHNTVFWVNCKCTEFCWKRSFFINVTVYKVNKA